MIKKELLRMEHVVVQIGTRTILTDARLNVLSGEVVGVLGTNNSGKSVLAGVLTGTCSMTAGRMYLQEKLTTIQNQADAHRAGIMYISRDTPLMNYATIGENFMLGPKKLFTLANASTVYQQCQEVLELVGLKVTANTLVNTLSIRQRILVQIARAIYQDARILILDDIFERLSHTALNHLHEVFALLCSLHFGVILMDSKLRHIQSYCQRIFVMRNGATVAAVAADQLDTDQLLSLMLGTPTVLPSSECCTCTDGRSQTVLLEMEHLACGGILNDLSCRLYQGEVTGVLNLGTNSGRMLQQVLQGLCKPDHGLLRMDGTPCSLSTPRKALQHGIATFTMHGSLIPQLSLEENIMFPALPQYRGVGGWMRKSELRFQASELLSRYVIPYHGLGGLEQSIAEDRVLRWKISFCQMLSTNPRLAVFCNPTETIDVVRKGLLYDDIRTLPQHGISVLLISSNIHELLVLSNRIYVLSRGRVTHSYVLPEERKSLLATYRQAMLNP